MGTICCRDDDKINPYSKKLMQIHINTSNDMSINLNPTVKESLGIFNQNVNNIINVYDLEDDIGIQIETNFRIIKDIDGLSQLNFKNNLYLCGANKDNNTAGSYFLKFDPIKNGGSNMSILINSIHYHYSPTMLGYRNDSIVVIGGFKSKFSEIYNVEQNKWRNLPDLPEERYKCSVINDENTDFLYLFGGLNSDTMKNFNTILRLNMKNALIWEPVFVKANSLLLARNSCAILKFEKMSSVIYIFGGIKNDNMTTDTIVSYDIQTRTANLERINLDTPSSFNQHTGVDLNKLEFFLFDDNSNIHKIHKIDFKIGFVEFKQVFELNDD